MASYPVIRRAFAHITPLALRAVGFSKTRVCCIPAARICRVNPLLQFCTASTVLEKKKRDRNLQSDEIYHRNLIRVLNSEIKCVVDSDLFTIAVDVPTGFPFKVEDNAGGRTIVLTREFEGENIRIEVHLPGKDGGASYESENETSIPIVMTVSKANDSCLQFGALCLPDGFSVRSLSLRKSRNSEDGTVYTGPNFMNLSEDLRNALDKYLENRGLTSKMSSFLIEYMMCKDTEEYLAWLRTLKKFIEH